MLLKNFYTLNHLEVNDNLTTAQITINKNHAIFQGHFPDNPITPGVCMMQIIKELTQIIVKETLFMESSNNIKFLSIINPEKNADLVLTLDISKNEDVYKVKNITKYKDTTALKLTANFKVVS